MKTGNRLINQSGFSAIVMVIFLMIIGLSLLCGFHFLVASWQKIAMTERRYYQQFNTASSSLSWAITQRWQPPKPHWQCQLELNLQLKVCIKQSRWSHDNAILVRGEANGFFLYTLAHLHNNKLIVHKGQWLDYCPEKRSHDCE